MKSCLAQHILVEYNQCEITLMNAGENFMKTLIEAVKDSGATYVNHLFHAFQPHGLSGIILIAESHVAFHTWPEHRYVAMDIFTCNETMNWKLIRDRMAIFLGAKIVEKKIFERGKSIEQSNLSMINRMPLP